MNNGMRRSYTGLLEFFRPSGVGAIVAVALLAAGPPSVTAQDSPSSPGQCEARFNPSTLEAGTVHEEVEVHLSQHIGDVQEVETPDDSGITILWTHEEEDDPLRARVRVSAVGANAGTWSIILWGGGEETCRGQLTIVDGSR